ncbi:MAG: cation diffusion facilitator family transporter [Rhodospirillales bacterium]|nr:cation diffusion facilitator family transporter [Rhodospirillales bacterium]
MTHEHKVAVQPDNGNKKYAMLAGIASLVTVALLLAVKSFAYLESGSVSILASLTDSVIDAAASLINFAAIRYSLKPADAEHRYGHGKIEGLAALLQGAFIAGAGAFLLLESLRRFSRPEAVSLDMTVIGIMAFSIVLSAALIMIQRISLRHAPSLAVEAEKAHYSGDIAMNGGVIGVLLVLHYGGPGWVDPVFSIGVAAYLGWTAKGIATKGMDMLLDRELPDDLREQILAIICKHPETRGVHDLRTRKSGMDLHIVFDLEIDADKSLKDAHEIALEVENSILELFPNAQIMIHKDPAGVLHVDSRHPGLGVHD